MNMKGSMWNGPHPTDASCPYSVDIDCKVAPAESLNSLESSRLVLTVKLQGASGKDVDAVAARLVNLAKQENIGGEQGELKRKTELAADLTRDEWKPGWWTGIFGVPVTWLEGGTRDYTRSGLWNPKSKELFALDVTYRLGDGSDCTARFRSEDAFHWSAESR
jgi:hypothetical protein